MVKGVWEFGGMAASESYLESRSREGMFWPTSARDLVKGGILLCVCYVTLNGGMSVCVSKAKVLEVR